MVLDEADRLCSESLFPDVRRVIEVLDAVSALKVRGRRRRTLLYSATCAPALEALARDLACVRVDCSTQLRLPEALEHEYVLCPNRVKMSYFVQLLIALDLCDAAAAGSSATAQKRADEVWRPRSAIVFAQTCRRVHELHALLEHLGVSALCLHSKLGMRRRLAVLAKFKQRVSNVLVCTDVASRGLDIPTVDLVVNFDMPRQPDDYVHRVGRCARAGRRGLAVSVVTQRDLQFLQNIETKLNTKLPKSPRVHEQAALSLLTPVAKAIHESTTNFPFDA